MRLIFLQVLCLLISLSSCVSQKAAPARLEEGRVRRIVVNMNSRGINHFNPIWWGLMLASIGSGIGTGATSHAIGAGSGALAGAGLGYAYEGANARNVTRIIDVEADSGVMYRLPDKANPQLRIGQRVWIAFDKRGRPDHIVTVPSA